MNNKGTYVNFNGETVEYSYENELSLSQKVSFIMEVAGMVVSKNIGYACILKETIFNYCLIKYFTDIVLFENEGDFSLDMIDIFVKKNKQCVIDSITKTIGRDTFDELSRACEEAIEFRKMHFSDCQNEVSDLLLAIRELISKPDVLSELIIALTNAVKSFEDKDIDMDTVNKLAGIIPVMKDMGSVDVAKTIVQEIHKNEQTDVKAEKPESNHKRKSKDKTKNNVKLVK
ncbi:MAG: hypothetical protein K1W34_10355 [Lachnospiraceae bacterium]